MSVLGSDVVNMALEFLGTPYRFGAEVEVTDSPKAFDCSEYVEYTLKKLLVPFADGSWNQFEFCQRHGLEIEIDEARGIAGALVFKRDNLSHRVNHVAFCDGKNNTVESRGKLYGTGVWPWRRGWTDAALIPGVTYPERD